MTIISKKVAIIFTSAALIMLTGCPDTNPADGFPGGVRIFTTESISLIGNSDFPVPGATYSGYQYGQVGNGNTGALGSVSGSTGAGGISDNPKAITDSYWSMSASEAAVIPVCMNTYTTSMYIPPTGGIFAFDCSQDFSTSTQ